MKIVPIFYALLLVILSCSPKEIDLGDNTVEHQSGNGIVGTWRLYETGYSVGTGTIHTTAISASPLQALTFTLKGDLIKEGNCLGDYFDYPAYKLDSEAV